MTNEELLKRLDQEIDLLHNPRGAIKPIVALLMDCRAALRSPGAGVAVILAIVVAFALTAAAFRRVRPLAAALMLPTLGWVLFATALNIAIATGQG